jgi:hypothetical protein
MVEFERMAARITLQERTKKGGEKRCLKKTG